jgi:hypothetical protein
LFTRSKGTHGKAESPNANGTMYDAVHQPVQGSNVLIAIVEQIASLIGANHHENRNAGYKGKEDGSTFEKFQSAIEKVMAVMNCTDEQKVRYATFKLTAKVERWWVAKKEHMQQQLEDGALIQWEDFKKEFLDQFFPQTIRLAKAQEFTDLLQGSTSMEQYACKFIELSRFAPYLIATKELKARKFEKGLHPQILDRVAGFKLNNLADLINNAEFYNQHKKRTAPQGNQTSGQHKHPNKRRNNHQVGCNPTPQGTQRGNGPRPNCPQFKKPPYGACSQGQGVCYKCGKLIRVECCIFKTLNLYMLIL